MQVVGKREITNSGMGATGIRGDGRIAVTGGWDGRLRLSWKLKQFNCPTTVFPLHPDHHIHHILTGDIAQGVLVEEAREAAAPGRATVPLGACGGPRLQPEGDTATIWE